METQYTTIIAKLKIPQGQRLIFHTLKLYWTIQDRISVSLNCGGKNKQGNKQPKPINKQEDPTISGFSTMAPKFNSLPWLGQVSVLFIMFASSAHYFSRFPVDLAADGVNVYPVKCSSLPSPTSESLKESQKRVNRS